MFGVDIILDENFKLYVIEINPSPMIIGNIPKKTNLFKTLIGDMFKIVSDQ
jgi:glutathione synthase/RimK-type ligase-like ATP-grasp enzyme